MEVCDVWSAMMVLAGWNEGDTGSLLPGSEDAAENEVLRSFLSDGRFPCFDCFETASSRRITDRSY